ncbi:MAG: hypothetical protein ABIU05_23155, partial [Nitrospirales bacterium]
MFSRCHPGGEAGLGAGNSGRVVFGSAYAVNCFPICQPVLIRHKDLLAVYAKGKLAMCPWLLAALQLVKNMSGKRTRPEWLSNLQGGYQYILGDIYQAIDDSLFFLASTGMRT